MLFKKPSPLLSFFFIFLGSLLFSSWFYLSHQRGKQLPGASKATPTATQVSPSAPPSPVRRPYFSYPGWHTPFTSIEDGGKSLSIRNESPGGFMFSFNNAQHPTSFIPITGDFALQFQLDFKEMLGKTHNNPFVGINLYNYGSGVDVRSQNYKFINIRISRVMDRLQVYTGGRNGSEKVKSVRLGNLAYFKSGKFRIEFKNVGKGVPETLVLRDFGKDNIVLAEKLPVRFFDSGRKLSLGFEVGNAIKTMSIRNLQFTPL